VCGSDVQVLRFAVQLLRSWPKTTDMCSVWCVAMTELQFDGLARSSIWIFDCKWQDAATMKHDPRVQALIRLLRSRAEPGNC
jgi:hypothetical protein